MSPKIGKNEEARQRSRAALLQAGADLMVESVLRNPFAALRLRGICERAGYSTGAFYLHWANVDEYYNDLAELLAADDSFDDDMAALKEVSDNSAGASALAAITRVADRDLQLLVDNPLYDAMELLNVTWGRSRFRPQMAHGYKVFDRDIGEVYGAVLTERGREPRPPLDWDSIGAILQALIEGFTLRYKVDPTAVPQSSEAGLGMYATAVAAVLAVTTRPVGADTNLSEAIQALLDVTGPATGASRQNGAPPAEDPANEAGDTGRMSEHADGPGLVFDESYWDERYGSAQRVWSGNPNPQLVAEVAERPPGRALDVGSGEGADAIWLARRGWTVVAADISGVALERAAQHARDTDPAAAGRIEWQRVDLLTEPPEPGSFDLVSAQFIQLPPEQRTRLFGALAAAVRDGGMLLVVGHHPSDLATDVPRPPMPELFYTPDEIAGLLDGSWTVEVAEARPRQAATPDGIETTIHDTVLVATRR
jgi:AcrR family transcriptional regulator/SAM-dependent methyltransferase